MVYSKLEDLTKRTQSDKVLRDKVFKIASDLKYDGYQRELASMVSSLIKRPVKVVLVLPNQIISLQTNFTGRLLENLEKKKFIHHLETIIEQIQQKDQIFIVCN